MVAGICERDEHRQRRHRNLGIVTLLGGATTTAVSVDTSVPGAHTIIYTVTHAGTANGPVLTSAPPAPLYGGTVSTCEFAASVLSRAAGPGEKSHINHATTSIPVASPTATYIARCPAPAKTVSAVRSASRRSSADCGSSPLYSLHTQA